MKMRGLVLAFGVPLFLLTGCGSSSGGTRAASASTLATDEAGQEKPVEFTADDLQAEKSVASLGLVEPRLSTQELQSLLNQQSYMDPEFEVPANLLAQALAFYQKNKSKISNLDYLGIIDYALPSTQKRFFLLRLQDGVVSSFHLAHGSGSDPTDSGAANVFSNTIGSNMSSLGIYLTGEALEGPHGWSLKLDGVSASNSNARRRGLVLSAADYVREENIKQGRGYGGLTVALEARDLILQALRGRAVILAGLSTSSPQLVRRPLDSPAPAPQPTPAPAPAPQPAPVPAPAPAPQPAPAPGYVVEFAPFWESKRPSDGRAWTLFSYGVVQTYGANLLAGTDDMGNFCPRYSRLTKNQKTNFWVALVSAVVKYESAFNPLSRFKESTMGIDPVTGQAVYSEGLMQLSYQDVRYYSFCSDIDWSADRLLAVTDPKKTILDPYINLRCGIRILNQLVGKHQLIAFNTGHYWSTLQPKNSTEQSIQALVNKIPFCQP